MEVSVGKCIEHFREVWLGYEAELPYAFLTAMQQQQQQQQRHSRPAGNSRPASMHLRVRPAAAVAAVAAVVLIADYR